MAVQVRSVPIHSMLPQQLPQQLRKSTLNELTTMNNKEINNSNVVSNTTDSFSISPSQKYMHLESAGDERQGKDEQTEEINNTQDSYNLHQNNNTHSILDVENIQEYSPMIHPNNINHKFLLFDNSKSTESINLKSNQLSGTITPPPPPQQQQKSPATDVYSQSPLEHHSMSLSSRLPKAQDLKKSLLKNSSGTNLNVYRRGNRRHSLTNTPITELLNSPKLKNTTNIGLLDSRYGTKSNNKNGNASGSSTPSLLDKKNRLVDQFYNSNRITSPNSRADLPSLLKEHSQLSKIQSTQQTSAPLSTPVAERRMFHWKEDSIEPKEAIDRHSLNNNSFLLSDDAVNNTLNTGGFGFNYDHNQIIEDDELLNYLLNIDNIIDHRTDGNANPSKTFDELNKIMSNIADKTLTKSRAILISDKMDKPDALKELERIENYLQDLKITTNELAHSLNSNLSGVTDEYKNEIREKVIRLNKVSDELKELEDKSNRYKEEIKKQKSSNMNQMIENLDFLDEINKNLQKHSAIKKKRLIIQINIICGVVILVFSIYYAYKGK